MMELGVDEGPASKLMSQVPAIVKALHKLLKDRSVKTRQGCFHILTELIIVLPGALSEHIPALIPGMELTSDAFVYPKVWARNDLEKGFWAH